MIKGMVLYKKSSGTKLLYSSTKDNVIYGVVQEVSGKTYPEKSVQAIISKGYWDAVYLTNDDVEKHQEHDQSSHGNWASSSGAKTPKNVDANKSAGTYTNEDGDTIDLWDNLSSSGAEDNPRLEQLCGLAFENINRGEKMMKPNECLDYTDTILQKYGYGDRLVAKSIGSKEVFGGNRSGVEAAIAPGRTDLLPEGNSLKDKNIPVLCLRSRGTTKPALLHEIAHIMEGSWTDKSGKAGGGHNEVWYETWHKLLEKEGLNAQANYLSFMVYKPEGSGVLNVD